MVDPAFALAAALIWTFSPIYYGGFLKRFDFLTLNFARNSMATAVLAGPALYFGLGAGTGYALLSGAITLAVGDSLFLLSIRETGASVATPVVYTYVLMVQLTASAVGVAVPASNLAAALMVVAGVFVLSRGGGGRPRRRGIGLAVAAALVWTVGQDLIQVATTAGGAPVSIAFARSLAATAALGCAVAATGRLKGWPRGLARRDYGVLAAVAVSDLALGSLLYVTSISLAGVAATVLLTSVSPFLTQVASRAMGREAPTALDFAGGALIVAALALAVLL